MSEPSGVGGYGPEVPLAYGRTARHIQRHYLFAAGTIVSLMRISEPKWQLRFLIGIVGLSLFFLLPSIAKYHGDERFYTDAAIRMTQTGDYFTPYTAHGAMRFAKPILTYWAVVAGYTVFGVNFIASRLPFLIAGCLVLWFTYRMSLAFFGRPREALFAALILASNVQLLMISVRSTPDALLCLFVLLSLLGFGRIIFHQERSWWDHALAWVGAGLAVQTRGLPGVGVALYPLLYCLIFRRGKTRLRELFEWKAFVLGLMAALFWFGLMIWQHGDSLVEGFYYDQVSGKVMKDDLLAPIKNLQAYTVGVLRHFLPWSALLLIALVANRGALGAFWREHRDKCWFLAAWYLFILLPFVFGSLSRTRYMLVAYPLLAVLLAALLSAAAESERFQLWQRRLLALCVLVFGIAGLGLAISGVMIAPRILAAGILLLTGAALIRAAVRRWPDRAWVAEFAALPLLAFWANEFFVRPTFSHSPAPALAARLVPDDQMRERVYTLNVDSSYEGQMRVLAGGRLTVVPLTHDALASFVTIEDPVIFGEKDKETVAAIRGTVEQVGYASRKWRLPDILKLFDQQEREAIRLRQRLPYYILFPEPGAGAVAPRAPQ